MTKRLIFPFLKIPKIRVNTIREYQKPLVDVFLSYKHKFIPFSISAIMDSASDFNIFDMEIAQVLGIKQNILKPIKIKGVGNKIITVYQTKIRMAFNGTQGHDISACFCNNHTAYQILGLPTFNICQQVIFDITNKQTILQL